MDRRSTPLLLLLLAALLLGGCGGSQEVTYVDPNAGDPATNASGSGLEPVRTHGVPALERAKAVVRIRAALAAARTLAADDPDGAADVVSRTIEQDLPVIEPRVAAARPELAGTLRAALVALRDRPPANAVDYTREVRRIADGLLVQAGDVAVPIAARQDIGFRAAVLYETLQQAGVSYEAAFEGGTDRIESIADYRDAYGLVIDANTRQVEAVPEDARGTIRATLDKIARSSLPAPTPREDPRDPALVLGELSALADDVARAAAIDTTWPEPDPSTPDQLRSLKRSVASAIEAWERGARDQALRDLATADRTHLASASSGLAAVSPGLLAELERDVVITLPDAMRSGGDVAAAAATTDARIDEAIQLVEEELELLRDEQ